MQILALIGEHDKRRRPHRGLRHVVDLDVAVDSSSVSTKRFSSPVVMRWEADS